MKGFSMMAASLHYCVLLRAPGLPSTLKEPQLRWSEEIHSAKKLSVSCQEGKAGAGASSLGVNDLITSPPPWINAFNEHLCLFLLPLSHPLFISLISSWSLCSVSYMTWHRGGWPTGNQSLASGIFHPPLPCASSGPPSACLVVTLAMGDWRCQCLIKGRPWSYLGEGDFISKQREGAGWREPEEQSYLSWLNENLLFCSQG